MEVLYPFIIAILVSQIISLTLRNSAARHLIKVNPEARIGVMEYSPTIKVATFLIPGAVLALMLYMLVQPGFAEGTERVWLIGLTVAALLLACLLGLESIEKKVRLDDQGLLWTGIFHTKICLWDEIHEVRFCRWRQMLVIETNHGMTININPSLSGQNLLEALLWENVSEHKFRTAIYQLNRL